MRHYEIVFLIHPDQSEQVPAMLDRYRDMVTSGGGILHRQEDWGRRILAYMINDVHKAHYVMINIECPLAVLTEIERNFKFNDSVLRYLVIRRKRAITEESPMAKAKAKEDMNDSARKAAAKSSPKEPGEDNSRKEQSGKVESDGSGQAQDSASGKGDPEPTPEKSEPPESGDDQPENAS